MEIPYVVTPRKDTGLFNSKIAIWLFLASEVMLFGGFFSAYVFLRLGADYPWPERTLPVLPGLINTFILIASSVTVVFAWASLKMRKWRAFQVYMTITVACALVFMVFKGLEYNVKFHHQAVRLHDYTVIEGHLDYDETDGRKVEKNLVQIETTGLSFSTRRFHEAWVTDLLDQAARAKATITVAAPVTGRSAEGAAPTALVAQGEPLSVALLERVQQLHIAAQAHNSALRTAESRKLWTKAKGQNPDKRGWELAPGVSVDVEGLEKAGKLLTEIPTLSFKVDPPVALDFKPRDILEGPTQSRLRDDTQVEGKLLESPMVFHHVDAIDFRHLAMKAVEKGLDPMQVIDDSWLIKNHAFAREAWEWHKGEVAKLEKQLIADYGVDKVTGKPDREPTAKERYRIGWQELAKKAESEGRAKLGFGARITEEFTGPNYKARGDETFPHLSVPRDQIRFASKFTPSWNTYYAIYFTITGLHGLHVVGGALVLAYYLLFCRKFYEADPEWFANRVEVAGLFWHFVDLVWIFAFPIFYLM